MHGLVPAFFPGPASARFRAPTVVLAFLLSMAIMPGGALQPSPGSTPPSAAPELVAHGTSSPGDGPAVWHVSMLTVDTRDANPVQGPTGFVVAGDTPLRLVLPDDDGAAVDVRAGEGHFLPAGQRLVTAGTNDTTYAVIELAPEPHGTPTPETTPGDLFTSQPFGHPPGTRALELWRASLSRQARSWTLPPSDAPIALLVMDGAIEVTPSDGTGPVTLVAGEAGVAHGGDLVQMRGSADAVVYAARIGEPVPGDVTPTATVAPVPTVAGPAPSSTSPTATTMPTATTPPSPTPSPKPEPADSDGDGLSDEQEKSLRTNPYSNDSDLDGVFDGYEVANGYNPLSPDTDNDGVSDYDEIGQEAGPDPGSGDADADGLTDGYEAQVSMTNPNDPDSDDDGLNDGDEIAFGSDPLVADTDNDGLNDGAEMFYGTNPRMTDSDGDFLWDGEEVSAGLNPASADSDGDGLTDGEETDTSPVLWDTDGDGLGDGEELSVYGTNPLDYDTDNDCDSDGVEIANGTNPFQGVVYEGLECNSP